MAVRLLLRGRVQGVGFRQSCRRLANRVAVAGWVRNLPDGRVEAWLEGDPAGVDAVASWCQAGRGHSVTGVEIHDETPRGETGFRVRHDLDTA